MWHIFGNIDTSIVSILYILAVFHGHMFVCYVCILLKSLLVWMWYLQQKWCNVPPPLAIEAQDFPRLYWWVLNGAVGDSSISSQVFPGSIAMFYWRFQDQLHSQVGTDWNATARGGQQLFHREAVKRWCFWEGDPQFHFVEGKSAFCLNSLWLHPCPVGIPCRWMDLRFHNRDSVNLLMRYFSCATEPVCPNNVQYNIYIYIYSMEGILHQLIGTWLCYFIHPFNRIEALSTVWKVTIQSSPPEGIWRWWRRGSSVTWGLERIGATASKRSGYKYMS